MCLSLGLFKMSSSAFMYALIELILVMNQII